MNIQNDPLSILAGLISGEEEAGKDIPMEEWKSLIRAAQEQGVAPILYWNCSNGKKNYASSESVRTALKSAYAQTWKKNQIILNELKIFADRLHQENIPAVLLKGACYALTLYPDPGTRPMEDCDLLVSKNNLARVVDIAKELGYENETPEASRGLNELLGHAICLNKKNTAVFEIHNSLVADKTFVYAAPVDWFWTQTKELNNPRYPGLLMLNSEAQVLYASAHAMLQHGGRFTPLRWFVDLNLMLRRDIDSINWDELLAQAKKFEWGSALKAALMQTQQYFHTPVPQDVQANLSGVTDRHAELVNNLKKKPATHVQEELQKLSALNLRGKIRLLLALVIPSPEYMRWRYGIKYPLTLPLYYLARWGIILQDGVRTLFSK